MFKKTLIIVGLLSIGTSGISAETNSTREKNAANKNFIYEYQNDILAYTRSGKKSYVLGEPIGIELKLKKDAYMYFWSVSKEDKSQLILPNNFESYNVYKKDIAYTVPEVSARYSFVPIVKGIEEIYVLANPTKLTQKEVKIIIAKEMSSRKLKKTQSTKNTQKFGIMVLAKKPRYDIAHLRIIVYANQEDIDRETVVKIAANPYGSTEGYYPVD